MLGILGPNGAGKSTALKLLYRILRPDSGQVQVRGRVGGLIELGAGFHPYLSGRENVFINGTILGMKLKQIRAKYDGIVEFSGLADFMDMPVKDYSSGMYARLAFAIAAHAEPDVLLVDEVLGVGDASFQLKCYDWMARMRRSGRAVVNVSHDMSVMSACTHCICLDKGRAAHEGEARKVIQAYLGLMQAKGADITWESSALKDTRGIPRVEVTQVEFLGETGQAVQQALPGADITIRFSYRAHSPLRSPIFALALYHDDLRIPLSLPRHCLFQAFSGEMFRGRTIQGAGEVDVLVHGLHPWATRS
jgi:ABC-type polysaccharide/polyol phosphate transport system ATPase subunit